MNKIIAFQTEDGKMHINREAATKHEFILTLRGFIQSKNNLGNTGSINVTQAAETIAKNFNEFNVLLLRYKRQMAALSKAKNKETMV